MILEEDAVKGTHYTIYTSKVNFGEFRVGDYVFVYKALHGREDLTVYKGVPIDGDKVHYFFDHELDLEQ